MKPKNEFEVIYFLEWNHKNVQIQFWFYIFQHKQRIRDLFFIQSIDKKNILFLKFKHV